MLMRLELPTLLILLLLFLSSCSYFGGNFKGEPLDAGKMSSEAKALIHLAVKDIKPGEIIHDYHVHIVGLNEPSKNGLHHDLEKLCPPETYPILHQSRLSLHPSRFGLLPGLYNLKTKLMFHAATASLEKTNATWRYH